MKNGMPFNKNCWKVTFVRYRLLIHQECISLICRQKSEQLIFYDLICCPQNEDSPYQMLRVPCDSQLLWSTASEEPVRRFWLFFKNASSSRKNIHERNTPPLHFSTISDHTHHSTSNPHLFPYSSHVLLSTSLLLLNPKIFEKSLLS